MRHHTRIPLLSIIALMWVCMVGCGDKADERLELPPFFASIHSDDILSARLTFDLDSLVYLKDSEQEVQGVFSLLTPEEMHLPVEIRARGVTRKGLCPFPPLRVQLKKATAKAHEWAPFRNYKLVTHCHDSLEDQQLVLREFLTYRIYQELTDVSFRTQLLDLEYHIPGDTIRQYAFLIENETELNTRLGLQELDVTKTKLQSINLEHYQRCVLFQYMIGNTDWNPGTGHNTKFVLEEETRSPIVIPYDFDYCGLVNAPYARPYETLPIDHVRQRHCMYRGKKHDDFEATVHVFVDKKHDIYNLVRHFDPLHDHNKEDMIAFLDEFYQVIEHKDWKNVVLAE